MSALSAAVERVRRREATREPRKRPRLKHTWWRHLVGILACLMALFPVWFLVMAAISHDNSVSGTSWLPTHPTFDNFSQILRNKVPDPASTSFVESHFLRWFGNTLLIADVTAIFTVLLGGLAA